MKTQRQPLIAFALALVCAFAAGRSVLAQSTLFADDFYKTSGYDNVLDGAAFETATVPKNLYEVMVTPIYPNFQVCVLTELDPNDPDEAPVFVKKMIWQAVGDTSGATLAKGKVKGKLDEVNCQNATDLAAAKAAADGDAFIFWLVQYKMKGNFQYDGYLAPAIWNFPYSSGTPSTEPSVLPATMSREQFRQVRKQLLERIRQAEAN
jgi:hypothetical protein